MLSLWRIVEEADKLCTYLESDMNEAPAKNSCFMKEEDLWHVLHESPCERKYTEAKESGDGFATFGRQRLLMNVNVEAAKEDLEDNKFRIKEKKRTMKVVKKTFGRKKDRWKFRSSKTGKQSSKSCITTTNKHKQSFDRFSLFWNNLTDKHSEGSIH